MVSVSSEPSRETLRLIRSILQHVLLLRKGEAGAHRAALCRTKSQCIALCLRAKGEELITCAPLFIWPNGNDKSPGLWSHVHGIHNLHTVRHLLARKTRTAQSGVRANAVEKAPKDAETTKKTINVELAPSVSWTQ